jgi:hypothetical protein
MSQKNDVIVDVDMFGKQLLVKRKENGHYDVIHDGVVRHPDVTAENAIGALGHYIHGLNHNLEKLKK